MCGRNEVNYTHMCIYFLKLKGTEAMYMYIALKTYYQWYISSDIIGFT